MFLILITNISSLILGISIRIKKNKLHKLSLSLCSKNKSNRGYYKCNLSINNKQTVVMPHRLVALNFVPGYFNGAVVNHKDGNTLNNKYDNLEWITQKNNIIDGNIRNMQTFTKWCYQWQIVFPDNTLSPILNGKKEVECFIAKHNLACKYHMIIKHKQNKGYRLIKIK